MWHVHALCFLVWPLIWENNKVNQNKQNYFMLVWWTTIKSDKLNRTQQLEISCYKASNGLNGRSSLTCTKEPANAPKNGPLANTTENQLNHHQIYNGPPSVCECGVRFVCYPSLTLCARSLEQPPLCCCCCCRCCCCFCCCCRPRTFTHVPCQQTSLTIISINSLLS